MLDKGGADIDAITIESLKLETPTNAYDADYAWVAERNGTVSLFFAKGDAGHDAILSRVEVRYPPEAFVGHFWHNSRDFHRQIREQLAGSGLAERYSREHAKPAAPSPIKQHSVWANVDILSRHGTAATLDFYYLSPAEIVRYGRTHDRAGLNVAPVLRVHTSIFELLQLLEQSEGLAQEYAPLLAGMLETEGKSVGL